MIGIDQMRRSRNSLIGTGIFLIVLAVLSSMAFRLPGSEEYVGDGLAVGDIIKVVIALIMFFIVLGARSSLTTVVAYGLNSMWKVDQDPTRVKASPSIQTLSREIANIVAIAIIWPIIAGVLSTLFRLDVLYELDWLLILLNVLFISLLLWRLFMGYQLLQSTLDVVSGEPAKVVAPAERICPKCGASNLPAAKFCSSCAANLEQKAAEAITSLRCAKCGTENEPNAKFCMNCAAPLSETTEK